MAESDFFDYTRVGQPDAMEPFNVADVLGMMSRMTPEEAAFVGCFFGEPGTRKTTRAMELLQAITPPDKKILYIYTGQGWTSLMNFPHLMDRVIKMPYVRNEQLETLRTMLLNKDIAEKLNIGAIVFDEYNRMQDMDTDILTKHRASLVNATPTFDKGKRVYKDPDTPEWPEYNTTKVRLINLLNDLLVLPKVHSVFICHTRLQKKTSKVEPDFPFAAGSAFMSMVHSLYYCTKENTDQGTVYPIELEGTQMTVSKNRIGGLPSVVYDTKVIAEAYKKWGVKDDEGNLRPKPTEAPAAIEAKAEVVDQIVNEEPERDILADMMNG